MSNKESDYLCSDCFLVRDTSGELSHDKLCISCNRKRINNILGR